MSKHTYKVTSSFSQQGVVARCKQAEIELDATLVDLDEAFNPVELLMASLCACMTRGVLRAAKLNKIDVRAVDITLNATRQDAPSKITHIEYALQLDTQANDRRLELIHKNVLKFGTITNTLLDAVEFTGTIGRLDNPATGTS